MPHHLQVSDIPRINEGHGDLLLPKEQILNKLSNNDHLRLYDMYVWKQCSITFFVDIVDNLRTLSELIPLYIILNII